eukprot:GHVH01011707.1.p2 GENE.GHVH01011707.1~~GHVH01011707.1.p2  ORF type:complete len:107 (-),score=6.66 GHVH01011707.1:1255-1575(-)
MVGIDALSLSRVPGWASTKLPLLSSWRRVFILLSTLALENHGSGFSGVGRIILESSRDKALSKANKGLYRKDGRRGVSPVEERVVVCVRSLDTFRGGVYQSITVRR